MSRMQHQRFELKYWISEGKARCIREFVRGYLQLDEFGVGQPDCSYPTLSLYLDSDGLDTYWNTVGGHKNRFKLRLRYYDERPDSPVFFEIKRRMNDIIIKDRGGVRKDAVRLLLAGHLPESRHLLQPWDAEQLVAVQKFCRLMLQMLAKPKMHVAYVREAYENPGNNAVRLTFDRRVESAPNPTTRLIARSPKPHLVFGSTVILELKFTNRYPNWFQDLVEVFDLTQAGAAKYVGGIFERGVEWVGRDPLQQRAPHVVEEYLSATNYPGLFEKVRHTVTSAG
jgi:hypothetical protein